LALVQAPDNIIYLFGTKKGCAALNEAWLREGKRINPGQ
jgi:hypothetical protein